jgi:hypothetical protein
MNEKGNVVAKLNVAILLTGEHVLTVTATDPDSDAKLQYSIVEPVRAADRTGVALKSTSPYNYKEALKINSTTGQVSVAKPLDHQAAAVIIITVQAIDLNAAEHVQEQYAEAEVTVYVQAYSSTNPVFLMSTWTPTNPVIKVTVLEEQAVGTTLLTLTAKDPLNGKPVTKFEEVKSARLRDAEDLVRVDQSGIVTLNKRLDYEGLQQKVSFYFNFSELSPDKIYFPLQRWSLPEMLSVKRFF